MNAKPPTLLVDENIPRARDLFGRLGSVRLMAGRAIRPADLADVDLLLIRSVTRITDELLEGSPVRFVGTATAGTDHVDEACLRRRGIAFASAPGSNAAGVADYVAVALAVVAARRRWELEGKTIGVIGHGEVGSRVVARARALGMRVLVNDPPLARATGNSLYRPLDEVLAESDVVSLHCCLTNGGPDATVGLADEGFLRRMRRGSVFINASRGEVVDEGALLAALEKGIVETLILDVWGGEPSPDPRLLRRADIASPHIGGYSVEGKLRGAQMIYEAACRFLGREPEIDLVAALPAPEPIRAPAGATLPEILRSVYDIESETRAMTALAEQPPAVRAKSFDALRRAHGPRREFATCCVALAGASGGEDNPLARTLSGLGFRIE